MSNELLLDRLKAYRCDRPDEWTMDEFIRLAEKSNNTELETVTKIRKMFVKNARQFGYTVSVAATVQELQRLEATLKANSQ
jgi:hypothetical protein